MILIQLTGPKREKIETLANDIVDMLRMRGKTVRRFNAPEVPQIAEEELPDFIVHIDSQETT